MTHLVPMRTMKMWLGNLDGKRKGLVVAASKTKARRLVRVSRKEFDDYWVLQPGVDQGLEFEVLYTRPLRDPSVPWTQGRCPLTEAKK